MASIREANASDANAIAAVHLATWLDAYAGIIPERTLLSMSGSEEARYWRRALARPVRHRPVLVAESVSAQVIGYASAGPSRDTGLPYDGEVYTLYVLPDYQGQGIGRGMLLALFSRMQAAGYRAALIWVLAENPSRFFYQALGGTWIAQRTERFHGALLREMAYGWSDLRETATPSRPSATG